MALVVDASAIISLGFSDEDPTYAKAIIEAINADRAFVPTLFWFELRNALLVGERRGRVTVQETAAFLADLGQLPFEVDAQPREAEVFSLARQFSLTIYDAAYLELAQRKGLPLASVDGALNNAARLCGVAIWTAI